MSTNKLSDHIAASKRPIDAEIRNLRDSLAALTRRVEALESRRPVMPSVVREPFGMDAEDMAPAKCPECGKYGGQTSESQCPACTAKPPPPTEQCWACGEQLIGKPLACPRCSNPFAGVSVPTPPAEQPELESAEEFIRSMYRVGNRAGAMTKVKSRDSAVAAAARKAAVREFAEKLISGTIGVEINSRTAWFAYIRTAAQEYAK